MRIVADQVVYVEVAIILLKLVLKEEVVDVLGIRTAVEKVAGTQVRKVLRSI